MSTNLLSQASRNGKHSSGATQNSPADLVSAFVGMAAGITRPYSVRWRLDDAARGRPVKPLGSYPEVAEECVDAGGTFHDITRPLSVMLAHLRRRCGHKLPTDIRSALLSAKKESDDAEAVALTLAFSAQNPDASTLIAFTKESDEAILALEHAKELAEDRLAEMQS